ncbi:glutathione peroxidase [Rathayibacter caricis DSM 15933]|uniref:Glutathione peroxidase n=1 Tax=Rathayibacter caricis DSM 15933 TaxID=1328867 RepID=A0A2T4UR26_9MICO|nr:glutathione peroxidase [Rathayibacter caricis DSM 15933]
MVESRVQRGNPGASREPRPAGSLDGSGFPRRRRVASSHHFEGDPVLTDIPLTTIDGAASTLADYAPVKLIVNVASRCGLAPQYEKLEALQKTYGDRGFTVLGFPSNQFLQELSDEDKIKQYCSTTWGVTFPMFEKVKVNGKSAHPLYAELTKAEDEAGKAGKVKWNFEKFLVTADGTVHRFRPTVEPDDPRIVELIEASLPAQ